MREFRTAVAILLLLTSTFVFAQKVTVEYDKAADFSQYKSYAWVKGQDAQRPGVHLAIMGAIEYALQQQGLTKTEEEKADLLVRYFAQPDMEFHVASSDPTYSATGGVPLPGGTPWNSGVGPTPSSASRKGTLLVEMFDRAHHRQVWRSTGSGTLKSHKDTLDKIDSAVQKMFAKYPKGKVPAQP